MSIIKNSLLHQIFPQITSDKVEKSEVSLVGPNDKRIDTFGTIALTLGVDSRSIPLTAVVADITQTLILGNDFLQSNNMVLDYGKSLLTNKNGCALPITNVTFGPNTASAVAPAITCCAVTIQPGETRQVFVELPQHLFNSDSVLFIPCQNLGCASLPQILHRPEASQLELLVHNASLDPLILQVLDEIGCLTEGPVNADVMYLDTTLETNFEPSINEVRALDITPEQDQKRWESLLKVLQEDKWELSDEYKTKAKALLHKYRFLFALKNEPWGICEEVYHEIKVTTDTPIKQKPRPVPPAYQEELDEIIKDLLERGLIKESTSPWASPICLAKKCDGSLRLCVDYR